MIQQFRVGSIPRTSLARAVSFLWGGRTIVDLCAIIGPERRVIEIDAESDAIGHALLSAGWKRYLRLRRTNGQVAANAPSDDELDQRTQPYHSVEQIRANNAEVLIFSGRSGRYLSKVSLYNHAEFVLWAPDISLSAVRDMLGVARKVANGRIEFLGRTSLPVAAGRTRSFLVGRVKHRKARTARRYLSPVVGIERFFGELQRSQTRYAALRWFENLPEVQPGEDIDLLVADEHVESVLSLLDAEPGTIPFDVYSVSGLPGTEYRSMAYYPPHLARQVVLGAVLHRDRFRVPTKEHHFLTLAYHAVYHKAEGSGLPHGQTGSMPAAAGEHDYASVLRAIANELGIRPELSLEGLEGFLAGEGWRPPLDTLNRLAEPSAWLRSRVGRVREEITGHLNRWPGLQHDGFTVFFLREKAVDHGLVHEAFRAIEQSFAVLHTLVLDDERKQRVFSMVRGGNWNQGPWPASGGAPAVMIVALDLMPMAPSEELRAIHPTLTNSRVRRKEEIRNQLNGRLAADERCNLVHSSDSGREAAHYLSIAAPELLDKINHKVAEAVALFHTDYPVVENLTRYGNRAKVELIRYRGRLAVKKTFRAGAEKYFRREHEAMKTLARIRSEVPPILETGDNYFICPHYENVLQPRAPFGFLPLKTVHQALGALRCFYDAGVSLVDFKPQNLLFDRREGLKIIDYEFCYWYRRPPAAFEECYDLKGYPENFEGDRPIGEIPSYDRCWRDVVGLELTSLLHDPVWLQHLKRSLFGVNRSLYDGMKRSRRVAKRLLRSGTVRGGSLIRNQPAPAQR
jgi:hypothetical protein